VIDCLGGQRGGGGERFGRRGKERLLSEMLWANVLWGDFLPSPIFKKFHKEV